MFRRCGSPTSRSFRRKGASRRRRKMRTEAAKDLAAVEAEDAVNVFRTVKLMGFCEDAGDVSVADEAAVIDPRKNIVHLARVVDVLGVHILQQGQTRRAVYEEVAVLAMGM